MTEIVLADPGDDAKYLIDWSDALGDATLTSVTHTVPSPLTSSEQSFDTTKSYVKITGVTHGGLWMIEAQAILSSGEVLNRQFPLRGWNS